MSTGNITDITKLQFFSDSGVMIHTEVSYVLKWRLIPGEIGKTYVKEPIEGYFIGDIDTNGNLTSLYTGLINRGKILVNFAADHAIDKNGFDVFAYSELDPETHRLTDDEYFNYIRDVILLDDNSIEFVITIDDVEYTSVFDVNNVFTMDDETDISRYFSVQTIYTGDNTSDSIELYQSLRLESIDLKEYDDTTFMQYFIVHQIPEIGVQFPFVRYKGSFTQESVSTNFIASNTMIVLEKNVDGEDVTYERPYVNANVPYSLVFQIPSGSELHLIKTDDYEVQFVDEVAFSIADKQTSDVIEPLSFAFGFQTSEEGAYQNYLGIYIRSVNDPDKVYFMGAISVKSTAIGEDERFRTLLTNFGVPDPKFYSTLFAGQEYDEELTDYKLVNEKSKQLMLSYDQIFDYVGTYKALMNAIKFLGYYDLVFKEWYTIRTSNDTETDIAVQIFDTASGEYLKQKLATYGVSIEDFKNYSKINKLSMIYHINEIDESQTEVLSQQLAVYNKEHHRIDVNDKEIHYTHTDVPLTKFVNIYRNDEIITKLYAIKKWLEQHIIGVGAYIADISGEFVTFGWQKTQGYQTQHQLVDYSQEQYYTPDVKCVLPFKESHGKVACTLTELNNAVRIEDYENVPFEAFMKIDKPIDEVGDTSVLHLSNTIESPVLGDEFEFDLVNHSDHGTLAEWSTKGDSLTELFLDDGKITFLNNEHVEFEVDSSTCLPVITLENANIHDITGKWTSNIHWMIREMVDDNGNTMYSLKNYSTSLFDSYKAFHNYYVLLEPASDDAWIKYSAKNNYGIPLFMIHGYKFANIKFAEDQEANFDMGDETWILEIKKGDMLFPDSSLGNDGIAQCCAQLSFSDDNIIKSQGIAYADMYANEQEIKLHYTYHSERRPFTYIDASAIAEDMKTIDETVEEKVEADMQVAIADTSLIVEQTGADIKRLTNINYSRYIPSVHVAYEEYKSFINSSTYKDERAEFIEQQADSRKRKYEFDELLKSIDKHYTFNRCIDIDVTRLGTYELTVRAYDKYNNTFTSKYDNTIEVTARPVGIDTYISKSYSDNQEFFYRYNKNGELVDADQLSSLVEKCDAEPKFPRNYTVQDYDYNPEEKSVQFDNISYVIDTPKNNDYVIFENANERVVRAESGEEGRIKLYMNPNNPDHIKLYHPYTSTINIVVWDTITYSYIDVIECKVNARTADNYEVVCTPDTDNIDNLLEKINNEKYVTAVLNTTLYSLEKSSKEGGLNCKVQYDLARRESHIMFYYDQTPEENDPAFNIDDVVKIRYEHSTDDYINETAYRIIDINGLDDHLQTTSDPSKIYGYEYVIDGLINFQYTESDVNIVCSLTRANHYPVQYVSRVEGNGVEFNYNIGYDGYSILRDKFNFNTSQMMLDYYIDDSYTAMVQDYDFANLKKDWFDVSTLYDASNSIANVEMYKYHEFPVSTESNQPILLVANDKENAFSSFVSRWKVSADTVDDTDNWSAHLNTNDKETLYRSANEVLSISPKTLGAHEIELTAIDRYGNKLVNTFAGVYVKEK